MKKIFFLAILISFVKLYGENLEGLIISEQYLSTDLGNTLQSNNMRGLFLNPASIVNNNSQLSLQILSPAPSTYINRLSGLLNTKIGEFAVGLFYAGSDEIYIRNDTLNPYLYEDVYEIYSISFITAYGLKFKSFYGGISLNSSGISIYDIESYFFNINTGLKYRIGPHLLGFSVLNLIPQTITLQDSLNSTKVPSSYIVNYAFNLFNQQLFSGLDIILPLMNKDLNFGIQLEYYPLSFLSFNTGFSYLEKNFSIGIKIKKGGFKLEYLGLVSNAFGYKSDVMLSFVFIPKQINKDSNLVKRINQTYLQMSNSYISRANSELNNENFDNAKANLDLALIIYPENENAEILLKKIDTLEKESTIKHLLLELRKYYEKKDFVNVLRSSNAVLEIDSTNGSALFYKKKAEEYLKTSSIQKNAIDKGIKAFSKGKYSTAKKYFENILLRNPEDSLAQKYLIKTEQRIHADILNAKKRIENYIYVGRLREAKNLTKRYLKKYPDNSELYSELGKIQAKLEQIKQKKLLSGKDKFLKKNYQGALSDFEFVLSIDPSNQIAKEYVNKLKKKNKSSNKDTNKLYFLGIEAYTDNNYELAIKYWKQVLKIDPHNSNAKKNIQRAEARLKSLSANK